MIDKTTHAIKKKNAADLSDLKDESVSLVVTSPPYPMIEMWDESFSEQNPGIKKACAQNQPKEAFELMHQVMDDFVEFLSN